MTLFLMMGLFALLLCGLALIAEALPESWEWERRDAARRSAEPRYWRGPR